MSAARSNGASRYYPDHLRAEATRLRELSVEHARDGDGAAQLAAQALEAAAAELERAAARIEQGGDPV